MTERYYWLKLKEDFFDDEVISYLEEQQNGKEYVLFYLKICLKSLKHNGALVSNINNMLIPYDIQKLSKMTNTDTDTALVAMELLKKVGLVSICENNTFFVDGLSALTGSWSKNNNAERQRRHREKTKQIAKIENSTESRQISLPLQEALQKNNAVTRYCHSDENGNKKSNVTPLQKSNVTPLQKSNENAREPSKALQKSNAVTLQKSNENNRSLDLLYDDDDNARNTIKLNCQEKNAKNEKNIAGGNDPDLAEVITAFCDNLQPFAGNLVLEQLVEAYDRYGKVWCLEAVKDAALRGGRSVQYVIRVLESWERNGFRAKKGGGSSECGAGGYSRKNRTGSKGFSRKELEDTDWSKETSGWD